MRTFARLQRAIGFPIFSECIERDHLHEMVNEAKEEQITRSKLNSTTGKLEYFKQLAMREDIIIP